MLNFGLKKPFRLRRMVSEGYPPEGTIHSGLSRIPDSILIRRIPAGSRIPKFWVKNAGFYPARIPNSIYNFLKNAGLVSG